MGDTKRIDTWRPRHEARVRPAYLLPALVPGLGHVFRGQCGRGFFLFACGAIALNTAWMAAYLDSPAVAASTLRTAGLLLFVVTLLYSLLDVFRLSVWRGLASVRLRKSAMLAEAGAAHARGDEAVARRLLARWRRWDPTDPDLLFFAGVVEGALGRADRARALFRRCRRFDDNRRWEAEIARKMAAPMPARKPDQGAPLTTA